MPQKNDTPLFDFTGALCIGADPDIFFPEGKNHIAITREAKSVCSKCPIAEACLEYAIKANVWGVWGGTTMRERDHLRKHPTLIPKYLTSLKETGGKQDLVALTDENNLFLD